MLRIQIYSLLSSMIIAIINAVPIDNGVEGEPEIQCGPTAITVNFNTRNTFEGNFFLLAFLDASSSLILKFDFVEF